MTAKVIDGKAIADQIRAEVAASVAERVNAGKSKPGLATVLVGENPASQVYVRNKQKACAEVGIESFGYNLQADIKQAEL
ncbi:MAG TPA: bifunctional methylenetetrahydrofolate dehydrogenase/methenyltetrahydrofolate cyclohydrolase, partial [Anaerolineaceae bacterium]|nr:bifunctional methylenetetrahydrofolate dehydrogenase/methenyltetrahydrofolate cyclohydrolase [Anaerolineaceae bacterium]